MAVDSVRLVEAHRKAAQVAEAAALAGATQVAPTPNASPRLSRQGATQIARETAETAWETQFPASSGIKLSTTSGGGGSGITIDVKTTSSTATDRSNRVNGASTIDPPKVTVTLEYDVSNLVFYGMWTSSKTHVKVTRTASLCLPGQNPDTVGGTCLRPTE